VQRYDVRVLQLGGETDLASKAFRADTRGQLGRENLDDHLAAERGVDSDEHPRHATAAQLALEGIRVAKRGL
jgi:hypothetical protein